MCNNSTSACNSEAVVTAAIAVAEHKSLCHLFRNISQLADTVSLQSHEGPHTWKKNPKTVTRTHVTDTGSETPENDTEGGVPTPELLKTDDTISTPD